MTDLSNDFERRVTEALQAGADEAPDATGLVVATRRRARIRRRVSGGLVVGAALAIVAVPIGVVALGGDSPSGSDHVATDPGTNSPVAPEPSVPSGWQVQRWNGLEVAVPGDWTRGTRSSWCAGGRPEEARVERPTDNGVAIACTDPAYSFGLSLGSSAALDTVYESGHVWRYTMGGQPGIEQFVPGSWLGQWYDDTRLVQVNAGDRETVQQVLDSIQVAAGG
jgi:hypothetical protein